MISVIRVVEGPPTLPPDSTVTVGRSMLTIPVGTGHIVPANWYFPSEPQSPTRLLYLQHGFLASAPLYSYTAAVLAQQTNSIVVTPSLTSNLFASDAAWLGEMALQRAVADLFIGERPSLTATRPWQREGRLRCRNALSSQGIPWVVDSLQAQP